MYPLFKYYIGFIRAYYLSRDDIVRICKLCNFKGIVLKTKFMKYLGPSSRYGNVGNEQNQHYRTCSLYNNDKGGVYLDADPKSDARGCIFTQLVNIQGVERYTFFCPICKTREKQITVG